MKKKNVFAIIVLLLLSSCTLRSDSCDIVLTDNDVAVDGAHIVTEEEQDVASEIETKLRLALGDSRIFTNEIDRLENINMLLEIDPYNDYAYLHRSVLYYNLGELEKSYSDFRTVNVLYPQKQPLYLQFFDTKDSETIMHKLEKCIKNEPSNPYYLFEMGVYYFAVGNVTMASEYFEASLTLDDTQHLPYYLLAYINYTLGENEIAYEHICKAIELNSNNPLYYELKGKVSKLNGDQENVLNSYKHMYETCNHPNVCSRALYEIKHLDSSY